MRTSSVFAVAGVLALVLASSARAAPATGVGRAVVVGKNVEKARAAASATALRNAVESAVKAMGGPADGEDSELDAAVYAKASTFVQKSDVVSETVEDNVMVLKVSATLDQAALKAALGSKKGSAKAGATAAADGGGKKVLILATEQLGPTHLIAWTDVLFTRDSLSAKTSVAEIKSELGGLEAAVGEAFTNAGYAVIDAGVLKDKLAPKKSVEVVDIGNGAAASIASKADADFVVIVKGVAKTVYNSTLAEGGMTSGQANVAARMIRTKDARLVGAATEHAAQVHIDPDTAMINAINEAARLAADSLIQKAGSR